jgi:outer membrane lipoprotein-sorting protein
MPAKNIANLKTMPSCPRNRVFLILLATAILSLNAHAQQRVSAKAIVKRMTARYASLSSYQDEGVAVTTYDEPTGGRIEKLPFKTFFIRPELFRFEWLDYFLAKPGRMFVIWSNGKEAFTYWEPDRYEKSDSLALAIAGATGVSRGSAYTVSTMLIPEYAGFRPTELVGLKLVGEETIDGSPCYHLQGRREKDLNELWIGKQDYLLRKLREERKEEDRTVIQEEFHRRINTNHEIAKSAFDFKPPIALQTPKNSSTDVDVSRLLKEDGPFSEETTNWKEFNSEEGRFSVLLPGTPRSQSVTMESAEGRFEHHLLLAMSGGYICTIDYVDLPNQALGPDTEKVIFDASRDQWLKQVGGKLLSEATVSVDRHEGREVRMLIFDGEARLQLFLIDGRFYQFSIANVLRSKKPDDRIDQFFKSLKVFLRSKPTAD